MPTGISEQKKDYNDIDILCLQNNQKYTTKLNVHSNSFIDNNTRNIEYADACIDQIVEQKNELSSYLIKKVGIETVSENSFIKDLKQLIESENKYFIINQLYEDIDYKDTLSDQQKKLLEKLGSEYFPKTLNPEMCDLIYLQMQKHYSLIFKSADHIDYIPVFIPKDYSVYFHF